MTAPKRFKQNTTKATEIKRNGTEAIGIDQDGIAKSIDIEVLMTKDNVGLGDVDNTSDADKPVSTAQQAALDNKESVANVNTLKGTGWTGETVKGNAEDIATLNGDDSTEGSVAYDIKQSSDALKGVDYTEGSLKTHEDRLDTLEGADTVVGSVAKTVKDAITPVSEGLSTVKVKTTENDLAIQAIQRDQNLANQSESKINVSDYGIVALPKNATGNLKMKREGLTARNIVNGASVAIGGTVTFASVLSSIYYDTLHKVQITGTGSDIVVTNDSGAIANMAVINLTQTFSSVPTLAQCKNIFPTYFADTQNVPFTGRYRGRGKNLFDVNNYIPINYQNRAYDVLDFAKAQNLVGQTITVSHTLKTGFYIYKVSTTFDGTNIATWATSTATITVHQSYVDNGYKLFIGYNTGSVINYRELLVQIELGSTATTYAPFEAHDLYLTAPEGRSVPSAKDSVEVQDGKLVHVKRVGELYTLAGITGLNYAYVTPNADTIRVGDVIINSLSDMLRVADLYDNIRLTLSIDGYKYRSTSFSMRLLDEGIVCQNNKNGKFHIVIPYVSSGLTSASTLAQCISYLQSATVEILYQLATPITTPIDSDGSLPADASVLWEPAIPDVGIYSTKFDILDTDHPISSIDKLYKVDFPAGIQTQLTDAVIAGDGLSFTSASLTDGDLVNVIYFYSVANPEGLTTAEYLNSNVVVADTTNGKYYKYKPTITNGSIASWTLTEVV